MRSGEKDAMVDRGDKKKSKKVKRLEVSDFELVSNTNNVLHTIDEASVELSRKEKKKEKEKEKKRALKCEAEKEKDSTSMEDDNEKEKDSCREKRKLELKNNEEVSRKKHKKSRVGKDNFNDGREAAEVIQASTDKISTKKHKKSRVGDDNINDGREAIEVVQASTDEVSRKKHKKSRVGKDNCNDGGEAMEVIQAFTEKLGIVGEENSKLQINIGRDALNDKELKGAENRKRKLTKSKNRDRFEEVSSQEGFQKDIEVGKDKGENFKLSKAEEASEMENGKEANEEKDKKKKVKNVKTDEEVADVLVVKGSTGEKESKKVKMSKSKTVEGDPEKLPVETEVGERNKTKMDKPVENGLKGVSETKTSGKTADPSNKSKCKGKSKRVRFSVDVDVLVGGKIVRGKRYSEQEDEILKRAVFSYIEDHALGKDGLDMIMQCKNYPKVKDCWKHIAEALPKRPRESIYYRAHILFESSESRGWTKEEIERIRNHYREHGADWKHLADDLGKHRLHVKDKWRGIKLPNMKRGHWSQDEYQNLFNFVNMDLRMKAFEGKKSKHGMLRDNISWGAISDKLTTRSDSGCCLKWYAQLTSPMVEEGIWEDADDYRLLDALYDLDASCIEDVDWDILLEHRSGDVCRKRWGQMVNHIGEHGNKSFSEQVEVLSKRYCPELLETREAYDSQPIIP